MKFYIFIFFSFLFSFSTSAQNYEEMNKKELKEALKICIFEKDSMAFLVEKFKTDKKENNNLIYELKNKIELAEQQKNSLETKLQDSNKKLQESNTSNNELDTKLMETERKLSDFKKMYNKANEENQNLNNVLKKAQDRIAELNDSVSMLISNSGFKDTVQINQTNGNDFLNAYFVKPSPLNDNKFKLKLKQVLIGNGGELYNTYRNLEGFYIDTKNDGYNQDLTFKQFLPEFLDVKDMLFFGVKSGYKFSNTSKASEALYALDINKIISLLPEIEILKNKLVTFKYPDGIVENFLFSIKEDYDNNFRKTLQINLASEEVTSDGSKNNQNDITWKLFMIENECYLMMTPRQLSRIKFSVDNLDEGVEVVYDERNRNFIRKQFYGSEVATGKGYYFARKKDIHMREFNYMDPRDLVFLFKLIQQ
jgi:hypothetical protein